jgi:hypothetical protein
MTEVYLLSVHRWQQALVISSAVLRDPGREVFFIDPDQIEQQIEALALLAERLDVEYIDATGSETAAASLAGAGLKSRLWSPAGDYSWPGIIENFGPPEGICAAAAGSPSDCLKAAAAAVRLGFYFAPLENRDQAGVAAAGDIPLTWFGDRQGLLDAVGPETAEKFRVISGDAEALAYFKSEGLSSDYLVILNSADLFRESEREDCLGKLWVKGLSLHALILASYRRVLIFDTAADNPDPLVIERNVNRMVRESGMKPRFSTVVAAPAAVPFFYEEKKVIGAWAEEMIRDIHVRLNGDLFYDLSEGRLMQNTPGGLSAQLISTKRYDEIMKRLNGSGRDVLIANVPHVDTGIIFAGDQGLMEGQLLPLFEDAGFRVNLLQGRESHYEKISAGLEEADFFLYTGHGGPEGLHTHGRALNRADLPRMKPLVAYASACSTVALVPHWVSSTEGLEWQGVAVDSRQVIGLSFVEKGALCFIGGATIEDLQYSTSIYGIFMESLLVKGLSVGEALRETRHFISLYSSILMQKRPEAYRKYRWGTANALHQQVLIGDPAFVPLPEVNRASRLPGEVETVSPSKLKVTVEIPEERWHRKRTAVNEKDASRRYYRCRNIEVNSPYGEDVVSWGDYYRVAPDAGGISEAAVMSSFIHMTVDLPPGEVPAGLKLVEVETAGTVCLLCEKDVEPEIAPIEAAGRFRIPYLLQDPIELDMREGWAFSAEQLNGHLRLHWLAPLLLIDDKKSTATRVKKYIFEAESVSSRKISGKIEAPVSGFSYLVCAGSGIRPGDGQKNCGPDPMPGSAIFTMTGEDGSFELDAIPGANLAVREQYPLYDLLDLYNSFTREIYSTESDQPLTLKLTASKKVSINGYILDSGAAEPVKGALVRVFRGEPDPIGDPLVEAFAGEALAGEKGEFTLELPAGRYMLYATAVVNGKRYKSSDWKIEPKEGEDFFRIFTLDQAAIVRGRVRYEGYEPPEPAAVALKRFPKIEAEGGTLTKLPVNRDGSYECLVSFQDRFSIVVEEEGWQHVNDTNNDQGYKLDPQEILEKDYILVPADED